MQAHEKGTVQARALIRAQRLTRFRFGENRRVRVGWTAVIPTAAYGAVSGEGPDEALVGAVIQPAAISSSRFILSAEIGVMGTFRFSFSPETKVGPWQNSPMQAEAARPLCQ